MRNNRVLQLRNKRGLTQREIATAVGTSQQQIQRIESGVQSCRLDLALRLCAALQEPLDIVFPAARSSLKKVVSSGLSLSEVSKHENIARSFENAGIDTDPEAWTFKVWVRHHPSECFSISGIEQKRLRRALQQRMGDGFVVFDSESERIALNPRHLLGWHFLWDAPSSTNEKPAQYLEVYLQDRTAALKFEIDPDSVELSDEESDASAAQFQQLLLTLESVEGDDSEPVSFVDSDGEEVFLRWAEIALLRLPLWATELKLAGAETEANTAEGDDLEMTTTNSTERP